jgi:tetratricopeptide (TPR) repeat protein
MADFTINDLLENKNHDLDYLYCLKGVTSFLQEKNSDAKIYFEKAIEINPNISTYFHSLALINYMLKDDYNAIKNISSAISISPEQIEYKTFRREMYINNKQWQSALSDADYIIENSDVPNPWDYLYRGVIKSWLNINSCSDYEKGYRLALSLSKVDENYNLVLEELRKNKRYCN